MIKYLRMLRKRTKNSMKHQILHKTFDEWAVLVKQ